MKQKILVLVELSSDLKLLEGMLLENNYAVETGLIANSSLHKQMQSIAPDVLILHVNKPDIALFTRIRRSQDETPVPIVLFSSSGEDSHVIDAINAGANAYVVDGIEKHRITPIINAAIARFKKCQNLRGELSEAKLKLAERRDIERAKGILMTTKKLSEDDAYQLLRKMAMDKNQKLGELSKTLITAAEIFQ